MYDLTNAVISRSRFSESSGFIHFFTVRRFFCDTFTIDRCEERLHHYDRRKSHTNCHNEIHAHRISVSVEDSRHKSTPKVGRQQRQHCECYKLDVKLLRTYHCYISTKRTLTKFVVLISIVVVEIKRMFLRRFYYGVKMFQYETNPLYITIASHTVWSGEFQESTTVVVNDEIVFKVYMNSFTCTTLLL